MNDDDEEDERNEALSCTYALGVCLGMVLLLFSVLFAIFRATIGH